MASRTRSETSSLSSPDGHPIRRFLMVRWHRAWPVVGVAYVLLYLWNLTPLIGGHDFGAYIRAGARISSGESLYLASLLSGETSVIGENQYLYPPLLAQLISPFSSWALINEHLAYLIYLGLSGSLFAISLVGAWRLAGGRVTVRGVIAGAVLVISHAPTLSMAINGNLGMLLAGCVTLSLYGRPLLGGVVGAMFKVFPGALLLGVRRGSFGRTSLLVATLLVASSIALSPSAWRTYLTEALPATVENRDPIGLGGAPAALARRAGTIAKLRLDVDGAYRTSLQAEVSQAVIDKTEGEGWAALLPTDLLITIADLETPLRGLTLFGSVILLLLGIRHAGDPARRHVSVAYLMAGALLVPWIIWEHYLLVLLPPAIIAWRIGDRAARLRLVAAGIVLSGYFGLTIAGVFLPLVPGTLLLLDGIRRTRLPEPAADAR